MAVSVLCDIACELGEGIWYDFESRTLWWFDISGKKLVSAPMGDDQSTTSVTFHSLPFTGSVVAQAGPGRQLIASDRGLFLRDFYSGVLTLHCELEPDKPGNRTNDGRVHPSGALWVGTMDKNAEREAGAFYWHRAGEVRKLFDRISIPNATCFSPAGDIAYFTDSIDNRLMRVACDPSTGLPKGEPEVFIDGSKDKGVFDGSVCDGDGVIWNARWGAASLDAWSPQGERIRSIPLPAKQVTCPAFIGGGRLAVTSAWEGMDWQRRGNDPQAGFTFVVDAGCADRSEPEAVV